MNQKIKCIILDDELPGLAYLKMLCEHIDDLEIVKAYNNPKLFMSEIASLDFDLCILDIEMGDVNGLQVAEYLKNKLVVFSTAYKEYAAEAFDLNAVDYIRKPLQMDRLKQAIDKVRSKMKKIDNSEPLQKAIQFNSDKGRVLLYPEEINYITISETDSRDKQVFLGNGLLTVKNTSFDKLLESLPANDFCRINKKEIISMRIVQYYTYDEIVSSIIEADAVKKFTLSNTYRNDFLAKIDI